ncbi:MAG: hypothetical protein ACI8R8_003315, partial [Paraglaciecola sp.]
VFCYSLAVDKLFCDGGHSKRPACLDNNWLLEHFSQNKLEAIERDKEFVAEGLGGPSI